MKKKEQLTCDYKEINTQSTTRTSSASKFHLYLHIFAINLATHYKESKTWLGFTLTRMWFQFENGIKEVESRVVNTSKVLSCNITMLKLMLLNFSKENFIVYPYIYNRDSALASDLS